MLYLLHISLDALEKLDMVKYYALMAQFNTWPVVLTILTYSDLIHVFSVKSDVLRQYTFFANENSKGKQVQKAKEKAKSPWNKQKTEKAAMAEYHGKYDDVYGSHVSWSYGKE